MVIAKCLGRPLTNKSEFRFRVMIRVSARQLAWGKKLCAHKTRFRRLQQKSNKLHMNYTLYTQHESKRICNFDKIDTL